MLIADKKKLLGIMVLGLLLSGNAYAEQYIEQTIDYSECAYKLEKGKILYSDYNNYNEHNNDVRTYKILFIYKGETYQFQNTGDYALRESMKVPRIYQDCIVYKVK